MLGPFGNLLGPMANLAKGTVTSAFKGTKGLLSSSPNDTQSSSKVSADGKPQALGNSSSTPERIIEKTTIKETNDGYMLSSLQRGINTRPVQKANKITFSRMKQSDGAKPASSTGGGDDRFSSLLRLPLRY